MLLSHRMYLCARPRRLKVITWSRAQLRDQLLKLLEHKIVWNFIPSICVIPVHSDYGAVLSASEIFQGLSIRISWSLLLRIRVGYKPSMLKTICFIRELWKLALNYPLLWYETRFALRNKMLFTLLPHFINILSYRAEFYDDERADIAKVIGAHVLLLNSHKNREHKAKNL